MKSLPSHGSHFLICLVIKCYICFVIFGPVRLVEAQRAVSITRHYQGDLYQFKESNPSLQSSSSCECGTGSFQVGPSKECQCQCFKDKPTLRDDTLECVNEFPECVLAEFVSSTQAEKIPYVYIPSNGHLLHPTAEIALLGLNHGESQLISPICIVTNGQFLNQNGWQDLRNSTTFEAPFRLQPDSGKTYLQWTGDNAEKVASRGRVILVQLLCRDAARSRRTLFHPCVAFRVAGSPDAEEFFGIQEDPQEKNTNDKILSTGEALAIGLVLGGLIIAYILVSLVYWRIKHNNGDILKFAQGSKQLEEGNSVPTKGTMTRNTVTVEPSGTAKKPKTLPKTSLVSSEDDSDCDDLEDLSKKAKSSTKPIRKKQENGNTTTADVHDDEVEEDIYSIPSELEEKEGRRLRLERLKMEIKCQKISGNDGDLKYEISPSVFGFSVAETIGTTASGARALGVIDPCDSLDGEQVDLEQNENLSKKKLYFNPAYFEPENLQSPPPAAVEFLSKIREMISVAKDRMQIKTFQPSLIDIPEDDYGSHASRTPSTSSNARGSSQQTYTVEELEECEEEQDDDPIYSVATDLTNNNILEEIAANDFNPQNTLKRLAQRVNTHGQTLVSEIVQTLDLKPRLPDAYYNPYPTTIPCERAPPRPTQKPVNFSGDGKRKGETVFPELIKPSMLRGAMNKDAKNSLESTHKFENFRQEMRATLSKVKAISPASSLSRNKSMSTLPKDYADPKPSEQGENKVQKWLQSLDGKNNLYTKINDANNLSSRDESKSRFPTRTVSFIHPRQPSLSTAKGNNQFELNNTNDGQNTDLKPLSSVFRSHSLIKDSVKSDSPFQRRQRTPTLDENKNYATSVSDDSLNQFVNNAISKVPKFCSSDTDSIISDPQSRYKDSLEYNNIVNEPNQKPYYPEILNDLQRSCNSTSPLSIRKETNVNTNGTGLYGNPFHSDPEISQENSYEEIHFGTVSKSKIPEALKLNDARVKKHVKEIRVGTEETEDIEKRSLYSNPDSLISEIHISGDNPIGTHSIDNRLSIELTDNTLSSDSDCRGLTNSNEKKKKKTRKVKRNDSILQDSLERPKTKKKNSNQEKPNSLENEETINNDHQLSKEGLEDPFTDIQSTKDDPTKVRRSKTMRTFKDYQAMKFTFKSGNNSKLSVVGEGIHLTYRTPSPSESSLSSLSAIHKPPLPPKQPKHSEDSQPSLDSSINSFDDSAPSIPPKHKLRYSTSLSSDLQLKSLRTSSYIPDVAPPKLPPKIKHRNSFSDTRSQILVPPDGTKSIADGDPNKEPPQLPEKSRRWSNNLLSHSSSKGSIPELTEEEANSILHGVLALSPSLASSISESIYSQGQNFLENGNIVNDSDDTFVDNVPDNLCDPLLDYEDDYESKKENIERRSVDLFVEDYKSHTVGEEVIRGQFILSNSRPPTLRRQNSSIRESSVMAQIKEMTANLDPLENGLDGSLAMKIKAELEKHFIEKSGADSIKRTWRKVLEKVDSNEKLTLKDLQKYILSLRSNQAKSKNEDSGYQSGTDSSDSSRVRKSKLIEQFKSISLKPTLQRSGTIAIPSGLRKKTSSFFHQRSSSLQHLLPGSLDINLISKDSFKFNRNKLTSSMERRKEVNPRLSVYRNNSFSIEAN